MRYEGDRLQVTGDGLQVTGKEKPRAVPFVTVFCVLGKKRGPTAPCHMIPLPTQIPDWV
jgi:hypothetical protein